MCVLNIKTVLIKKKKFLIRQIEKSCYIFRASLEHLVYLIVMYVMVRERRQSIEMGIASRSVVRLESERCATERHTFGRIAFLLT